MSPFAKSCYLLVLAGTVAVSSAGLCRETPLSRLSLGNDTNWLDSRFFHAGPDAEVFSCMAFDGDLIVSGNFATVGRIISPGVARWDGNDWIGYPGLESGGRLVDFDGNLTLVRGWPEPSGSYTLFEVLSWNGSSWDAGPFIFQFVGSAEVNRIPNSAEVLDGNLYITPESPGSAYFEFSGGGSARIARWDGTSWSAFVPAMGSSVNYFFLGVWDNHLYVSGVDPAQDYLRFIDRWEGSSWTRTWSSTVGYDILDFTDHLGDFYAARSNGGVLRWDGATWSSYATTIPAYQVSSNGSELAVFTGTDVQGWDGSVWNPVGTLQGSVNDLENTSEGLVAVGDLEGFVSVFDGTVWDVPGNKNGRGLAGEVNALGSHDGRLLVAGQFVYPGSNGSVAVAAWDGANWEKLVPSSSSSRKALSMTTYGENLVVGHGTDFGVSPPNPIAEWNGSGWNTLGETSLAVRALTVYDGSLIAGGTFNEVSGVPAGRLAAWNGTAWSEVGGGIDNAGVTSVDALAVWDGLLIVGGNFSSVDGKAISSLASWNGSQWRDLEPPGNDPPVVTGPVVALAVHDGNLIASGSFWGTDPIAAWDGHNWSPLGGGLDAPPQALYSTGDYLFVSGEDLTSAGGVPVNHIAAWDGSGWNALGSGLEHPRPAQESRGWAFAEYQNLLYVGGNFRTAGGKPSNHLALWASPTSVAVPREEPAKPVFALKPCLPNPCRTITRIPLLMPAAGRVVAEVFDIAGRNLGIILDRELPPGDNTILWNPRTMRTRSGEAISAGAYFIRVSAMGNDRARKVIYIP